MRRIASVGTQSLTKLALVPVGLAIALVLCLAAPARADRNTAAREQFEHAVKMRTVLESHPQQDRTLAEYKQTVFAYRKVYLISSQAEEVTSSLIAEGELYREMGRQYDAKYFQSAIDSYNFLLKQYPGSRYRAHALFSIAQIQKDDQKQPEIAQATFKEFLKRFPRSDKAGDARQALKEIAGASEKEKDRDEDLAAKGQIAEQRESDKGTPRVTDIRSWNADNYTRIVVTLEDTIKYNAVRISSPDRIYFDLYKAKLSSGFAGKTLPVESGLLKSVRVAQNKEGVVRLVLDVDGAKDYSAFLLSNPYRLVIDVHAQPVDAAKKAPPPSAPAAPVAAPSDAEKPSDTTAVAKANNTAPASVEKSSPQTSEPAPKPAGAKTVSPKPKTNAAATVALRPPTEPKPNRDGQRSLSRALGLKVSRIVIDPGHGGFDTGTIGPHGLMEKDLCLDVALRLGHLIEEKLPGAQVVYTRKDDTFIPLEDRTAMANEAKADLFISIHANSSHDHEARGVETYYLNFSTSGESMEVATRENSLSQGAVHDLQDLIKKIARNEKIEESKEFASDVQDSLTQRLQLVSHSEKNRGVKKAPFVVLIGANMPSVLSEISFISNPNDERLLRKGDQRQRIADGLYHGIASYLDSLNSLSYNKQKLVSDNNVDAGPVASGGNSK
jgi:N-acetylmuramoyl-L-alanine amidase